MNVEIFSCPQNSPEWLACRLGIPTASEFHTVMARGKGGGESVTRRKYMLSLIGERLTGKPTDNFSNGHTERGHEMEAEARSLYSMVADVEPVTVGFMRRHDLDCGASPDSLVGDDGLLEIKTKAPHIQLEVLLRRSKFQGDAIVPPEHWDQLQGQLLVSGRKWVDFVSYWPGLPLFCERVYRDEPHLELMQTAIARFNQEMAEIMAKVAA